jgi:hypothetical protein
MRTAVITLVSVLVLSLAAWAGQTFTSTDGGYSITFPSGAKPVSMHQKQPSLAGELDCYMTAVARNDSAFFVGYVVYPQSTFQNRSLVQPALEMGANAVANKLNGHVLQKSTFNYGSNPGLSASFDGKLNGQTMVGQANLLLVGNRLYMIYALGETPQTLTNSEARNFFSSFRLLQ